jgi:hypothetical protein
MRCPDCHKTIGRFDAANPPRCPLSARVGLAPVGVLAAVAHHANLGVKLA